jgi:enamine deaminase RidA (YjgF/YER057c/UK114 family)
MERIAVNPLGMGQAIPIQPSRDRRRRYTTDVGGLLEHWDAMASRLKAADVAPPQTLIGVARLAFAALKVELEATAAG